MIVISLPYFHLSSTYVHIDLIVTSISAFEDFFFFFRERRRRKKTEEEKLGTKRKDLLTIYPTAKIEAEAEFL